MGLISVFDCNQFMFASAINLYFEINRSVWFNILNNIFSVLALAYTLHLGDSTTHENHVSYIVFYLSGILMPFEIIYALRVMRMGYSLGLFGELVDCDYRFSSYSNHFVQMVFIIPPIMCLAPPHNLDSGGNLEYYGFEETFVNTTYGGY